MKQQELQDYIFEIQGADRQAMKEAKARQDKLAKPPESLGLLEDLSVKLAGMTGKVKNNRSRPCILIFSADNGVVAEGVSSAPQTVTISQTINFTKRLTGVGALSKYFDNQLLIVDVGINSNIPSELVSDDMNDFENSKIINRKLAYGTANLAQGPAMTRDQALAGISAGIEAAQTAAAHGYDILGIGEMGIGNTTTSSSILSALTGCPVQEAVGRGGGIVDASYIRKKEIVDQASRQAAQAAGLELLDYHKDQGVIKARFAGEDSNGNKTQLSDRLEASLQLLMRAGGFDICAMTGAFLAAAHDRLPVVVDGFISAVAALLAGYICPESKDFMIGSHYSEEVGYKEAVDKLDLPVFLNLRMRLGEGSGCVIAFQVIKAAEAVMNNMATFEEAAINDDYLEEIRKGGCF